MKRILCCSLLCVMSMTMSLRGADFSPPKDNVYTEKQLTESIAVTKEWMDTLNAAGKAVEGTKSSAVVLATIAQTDEKFKATLAKHNMSQEEYNWIRDQMLTAWGVLIQVDTFAGEQAQKDFGEQMKKQSDALEASKKKLADLEASQKSGRKILTPDERNSIIESAKSDEQSAADEAKSHADEAKQAADDATKADNDATEALKLAKNPPADISADDKQQYIKDRQSDADNAKQAAKDARDRETEAKKAQKESESKIAAAKAKQKDPDLPTTDDEKADVKKQTEEAIASTKSEIDQTNASIETLKQASEQAKKMADEAAKSAPKDNVDLLRKHRTEFEAIFANRK